MVAITNAQRDKVFKAISDPTRREILGLLAKDQLTVGEIAENFRVSRPAISKHLRLLRGAGLVVTRQEGAANICRLDAKPLRAVKQWLQEYEEFWNKNLRNLKRYVEEKR